MVRASGEMALGLGLLVINVGAKAIYHGKFVIGK